ncbi:NUDIX domain-containing protein [Amorphus coralli]|uniref:NUDIX domain-containing protein n=1 Tax=Amorphus coralli TaxID=340680 RepID=UPI00058B1644|nr:NUDIX domain-containing protein [Amorphus coralli]
MTTSAGILLYRFDRDAVRVLLVHPGGPYWRRKDRGAWSIPKGEVNDGESHEAAARREFFEELGVPAVGDLDALGEVRQRAGKRVVAFALEGDVDVAAVRSIEFEMEWPPRSGRLQTFPEVDRAGWFTMDEARPKLIPAQVAFVDRLAEQLAERARPNRLAKGGGGG